MWVSKHGILGFRPCEMPCFFGFKTHAFHYFYAPHPCQVVMAIRCRGTEQFGGLYTGINPKHISVTSRMVSG